MQVSELLFVSLQSWLTNGKDMAKPEQLSGINNEGNSKRLCSKYRFMNNVITMKTR